LNHRQRALARFERRREVIGGDVRAAQIEFRRTPVKRAVPDEYQPQLIGGPRDFIRQNSEHLETIIPAIGAFADHRDFEPAVGRRPFPQIRRSGELLAIFRFPRRTNDQHQRALVSRERSRTTNQKKKEQKKPKATKLMHKNAQKLPIIEAI
jgi:hypothetical protein